MGQLPSNLQFYTQEKRRPLETLQNYLKYKWVKHLVRNLTTNPIWFDEYGFNDFTVNNIQVLYLCAVCITNGFVKCIAMSWPRHSCREMFNDFFFFSVNDHRVLMTCLDRWDTVQETPRLSCLFSITANRYSMMLRQKRQALCYHFIALWCQPTLRLTLKIASQAIISAMFTFLITIHMIQFNHDATRSTVTGCTPTNVTFNSHSLSRVHASPSSTQSGTMLRVKWRDPDGSHLGCDDGLLRTGYGRTQMETHWEWPWDGHADYWFAQINDSQPGHLTSGGFHPLSWHFGILGTRCCIHVWYMSTRFL